MCGEGIREGPRWYEIGASKTVKMPYDQDG